MTAPQRTAADLLSADIANAIGRREFVIRGGTLFAVAALGIGCGDDGVRPGDPTGIVRVVINGLQPGFTSAGSAHIEGPGINRTITLPGVNSGEATVPVGSYSVVYTPPAGYAVAPGTPNNRTVVVQDDQVTEVEFAVVLATGTLRITVGGLAAGAPNGGSASALRTDVGGQTPIVINVPASGTIDSTVLPGTYQVTYTAPAGHQLAAGDANPKSTAVADSGVGTVTFAVELTPTTGILRVTVTGLAASAPSGGGASLQRTDIGGQTPIVVVIPASGSIDTSVTAGTYTVTYTAPAGHAVVGSSTDDVTVAVSAVVTAEFVVEEAQTPGGVAFHSDWSTATGTSAAALLDTNKSIDWDTQIGNGSLNTVVPAAGLGFPPSMANVFKNIAQFSSNASQRVLTQFNSLLVASRHIPIPASGEHLYYRWYQRWVVPDSIDTAGGAPHPIQDGPAASQTNWMWEVVVNQNGTWTPRFNFANANGFPNNRWRAPDLPKNQTYRIELHIQRLSATTFTAEAEIYDQAGALVRGSNTFVNGDQSASFASAPVLGVTDESYFGAFQCGNNGPSWNNNAESAFPFDLWYIGGVAIRTDTWCREYSGGI